MNTLAIRRPPGRRLAFGLLAFALLAALTAAAIFAALQSFDAPSLNLTIDGEQVLHGFDLGAWPPDHKLMFAIVVAVALLAALVVVPVALCFAAGALVLVLLLSLGLPLVAVGLVLLLVFSPLVLLVMGVVWLWRSGTKPTTIRR